jgi:hypothetical protein
MIVSILAEQVSFDRKLQHICKKPFYKHPHGCPNYGKKEGCPPQPLITQLFDFSRELYIIHTSFPVGEFAERMHRAHPDWNERQCYNPRLWQGTARKEHDTEVQRFLKEYTECTITKSPEAHGVNCTALMQTEGITLNWQWPPEHHLENIVYRISLGGYIRTESNRGK